MRKLLVVAALLTLMLTLQALQMDVDGLGAHPLTLVTIGFIVLASFTVGELTLKIGLPRITGYILVGLVSGPHVANIFSAAVVEDLQVFNTLALGLIATTAGLELDLTALRRVWRTLAATIVFKIVLLLVIVGGLTVLAESLFAVLGLGNLHEILALGLIMAVLGIGTSPAVALAVLKELGARGRLTDITLAIAVAKDLVVVVLLALAVVAVRMLIQPGGATISGAALTVLSELGASLAVGGALGGIFILYLRFVRREMLLAVVVAVLLASELSKMLHLELLLVFIAAGFVVRNFSRFEHELLNPLTRVSLPVFVVFFTSAGAGIDLGTTVDLLPLALLLVAGRALAYSIAGRWGAAVGGETTRIGRAAWMAYTPQAGVTLGLILLAGASLPELADPITAVGFAVVAVNLMVGPVLLGIAVRRAGEVPTDAATQRRGSAEDVAAEAPSPGALPVPPLLASEVRASVTEVTEALARWSEQLIATALAPSLEQARRLVSRLANEISEREAGVKTRRLIAHQTPDLSASVATDIARCATDAQLALRNVPAEHLVPASAAGGRRGLAAWFVPRRKRRVPTRNIVRYYFEPRALEALALCVDALFRAQLSLIDQVRLLLLDRITSDECKEAIASRVELFAELAHATLAEGLAVAEREAIECAATIGTRANPTSGLRLSDVEGRVRAASMRATNRIEPWHEIVVAALDRVRALAASQACALQLREVIDRRALRPVAVAREDLAAFADSVATSVQEAGSELDGDMEQEGRLEALVAQLEETYGRREEARLAGLRAKYRHNAQTSEVLGDLAGIVEDLPARLDLVRGDIDLTNLPAPAKAEWVTLAFQEQVTRLFNERFAPALSASLEELSELVIDAESRIAAAVNGVVHGLRSLAREEGNGGAQPGEQAAELIARGSERLAELAISIGDTADNARLAIRELAKETETALHLLVHDDQAAVARVRATARDTQRALARATALVRRVPTILAGHIERSARLAARRRDVRDWLIRSGQRRLDAASMAAYLREAYPEPHSLALPAFYAKVFTTAPLDDSRLAVAQRRELDEVAHMIQPGRAQSFANVLLVGPPGSGRTTFLNLLQRRLARHRVLRLDSRFYARHIGFMAAIATELGCSADAGEILRALRQRTTVVLIDDIERYIAPTPEGTEALRGLLRLVISSGAFTHWVCTLGAGLAPLLDSLGPLACAFGRRISLATTDPDALRQVIEARVQVAGVRLEIHRSRTTARRLSLSPRANEDGYFRAIAKIARGSLRPAILAHLWGLQTRDESHVVARVPPSAEIPFGEQIPTQSTAVLAVLLRYGAFTARELASVLRAEEDAMAAALLPLSDSGMVEQLQRGEWRVRQHLEVPIDIMLSKRNVIKPGVA